MKKTIFFDDFFLAVNGYCNKKHFFSKIAKNRKFLVIITCLKNI